MTIEFLSTSNEYEDLNKTFTTVATSPNAHLLTVNEVEKPIIEVNKISAAFNYVRIPSMGRTYKVTGREITNNNFIQLILESDVLTSFKNQILALTGTVARNENLANAYLIDSNYKGVAYKKIVTKKFPNSINNDTMYLRTLGQGGVL